MKQPIIISFAPNGAKKTKADHPNIPLFAEEIAIEAKNCRDAGAALIHLHIRDKNQVHLLDVETYRKTIKAIKDKVGDDLIIQVTSESVDIYGPEQQMDMVRELKPEAVSLAIREIIPDVSYEAKAKEFFKFLHKNKIFPQFILYSPKEVEYFAELIERGYIPQEKKFVLFVLGKKNGPNIASAYAKPEDLQPFVDVYNKRLKDKHVIWATCAFGGYENSCMLEAVKLGGNPRIGFENNLLMQDGTTANTNADLIKQFVNSLGADSARVLTPKTARQVFGI